MFKWFAPRMILRTVWSTIKKLKRDGFEIKVLLAFRPDKAMNIDNAEEYGLYIKKLEKAGGQEIHSWSGLLEALKHRHDLFATKGCSVSDHGLECIYATDYSREEVEAIFQKALKKNLFQLMK